MILHTLSTVLLVAVAQGAATPDQGLTDAELLRRLHMHHTRMAETADAVRSKSTNGAIKTFATTMANDHRRLDRMVASIAAGMKITLGKPTNDEEAAIDNRGHKAAMDKLKTMPADKVYDSAFLNMIGEDHNQFLNIVQTERKRTQNGRLKAHLNDTYTLLLKHRNRALELNGQKAPASS